MRKKKNREVNIFSASVVDLFASGLGVFLIVSIIALVNQKKEVSRLQVIQGEAKGMADGQTRGNQIDSELKKELENKAEQIASLQRRISTYENLKNNNENIESIKKNFEIEEIKIKAAHKKDKLQEKLKSLEKKNESLTRANQSLEEKNFALQKAKVSQLRTKFENYGIGAKIRLESVHFYPGTIIPIEPYASIEIERLAAFLAGNPKVSIEVSGHIFLSKKEIESEQARDETNLSGRRADAVCNMLVSYGIELSRLRCRGYGGSRFLFLTEDSYSKEAQLNRRVEVEILSK